MWILTGPFDGEQGKTDFQKPKLLKPNKTYTLGRKGQPLIIRSTRVSRDHCVFTVGSFSVDDVANPSARPSLRVSNLSKKDKKLPIFRCEQNSTDEVQVDLESSGSYDLREGDRVGLVSDVNIMVTWQPLCAYTTTVRGKGSISADACSALGIHLVHKPQMGITHYLTPHYAATLSHAASLLAMASIVKPEWLQEVIRLGDAPAESPEGIESGATYLEETFRLPSVTGYRPTFAPALSPAHKRFNIWDANVTRMNMLLGCRFLCLREKATEADKALVDAIVQGKGSYEVVDVQQGAIKFRLALGKGMRKEGTTKLIAVADADAMIAAVGQDGWKEFEAEAKNSGLEIIPPSTFIRAVLDVDINVLPSPSPPSVETVPSEGTSKSSAALPLLLSRVPNSIPDGSSVETTDDMLLAQPRKAPRRRVTRSASQSQEPLEVVPAPTPTLQTDEDILKELMTRPPPRRATRRIPSEPPFITGLNDPSAVIDGTSLPPRVPSPPMEFDFTVPAPPRSRLKRRVGVTDAGSLLTPASAVPDTPVEEPPLKKFKALFEETNPNKGSIDWENVGVGGTSFSETQVQTLSEGVFDSQRPPPSSRRGLGVPLSESTPALLREEEEEGTQSQMCGVKRSLDVVQEDEEMEDGDATSSALHGNKRRAVGDGVTAGGGAIVVDQFLVSNVSPTSPARAPASTQLKTKGNPGAPAGKPDKDAAFLKAIASTKRGKKVEDEFDREFNKLKIARPELDSRAQQEEEWKVLADFGDDSGLRGNFMTVVEIDVYRRDGLGGEQAPREVRREWDGRPNFKKFKKKVNGASRAKVEVFISGDYGMGPEYWKGTNTQAQTQTQTQNSQWSSNSQPQPRPQSLSQVDNVADDWQVRTESAPRKVEPTRGASFFDSGEENARSPPPTQRRGTSRALPPKKPTVPRAKAKVATKAKKSTLFLDSEDDVDVAAAGSDVEGGGVWAESMTLRSDGEAGAEESPIKVRKSSRQKVAPAIFEDDSDGGFYGFKGRKGKARK